MACEVHCRVKRTTLKNQSGMTLLEVMLAVFVLAVVALPVLNLFVFNATLVRKTGEVGDTTYAMQAVMEDLKPLGYSALYACSPLPLAKGKYELKSVSSPTVYVSRSVSIDRFPSGAFGDLVSGEACYAHLILSGSSASLTCPDGKRYTGLSYASGISVTATKATVGGVAINLNKPSGKNLVLIIHAGNAAISALSVNLNGTAACVLYALSPDDAVKQVITISNATKLREYRKYNTATDSTKDPLPDRLLVQTVCKAYDESGAVESIAQGMLQVKLP